MITTTDPIADMLTRIRNAILVGKTEVSMPYSKIKEAIAQILVDNHYLVSLATTGENIDKSLVLIINTDQTNANISHLERISKPGRRQYVNVRDIPTVKQGRGMVIISTSKGVMKGQDAKQNKLGGELICKVY